MTVTPISSAAAREPAGASETPAGGRDGEFAALVGLNLGSQGRGPSGAKGATGSPGSAKASGKAHDAKSEGAPGSAKDSDSGSQAAAVLSALVGAVAAQVKGIANAKSSAAHGLHKAVTAVTAKASQTATATRTGPPTNARPGTVAVMAKVTPDVAAQAAGGAEIAAKTTGKPSAGIPDKTAGTTGAKGPRSEATAGGTGDAQNGATVPGSPTLPATARALTAPGAEQGVAHSALTRSHNTSQAARAAAAATVASALHGATTPGASTVAPGAKQHAAKGPEPVASLPLTNNAPDVNGLALSAPATVAGSGITGTAGPGTAPAHVPAALVHSQVFGEVTRLISRGDGTHRITLQLHPADLGDVRVTLTLKDGAVSVSLAAGHGAQHALSTGAHELHRLLQAAGAHSADIVVKDLPSATGRFDLDPGAANGGHGRGHTPEQTAGTWSGDTSARDGVPSRATTPPSANPGTRAPSSGVDVSM